MECEQNGSERQDSLKSNGGHQIQGTSQTGSQSSYESSTSTSHETLDETYVEEDNDHDQRQQKVQPKWRKWWSKKKRVKCTQICSDSSSDDSDDDDDEDNCEIFAIAQCRMRRVIGKLVEVYEGVETICRMRYGPIAEDTNPRTFPDLECDRLRWITDSQWEKIKFLTTLDILQSRISSLRKLFAIYRLRMPENGKNFGRMCNENEMLNDDGSIFSLDSTGNCSRDEADVVPDRFPIEAANSSQIGIPSGTKAVAKRSDVNVRNYHENSWLFFINIHSIVTVLNFLIVNIIQSPPTYQLMILFDGIILKRKLKEHTLVRAFGKRQISGLEICLENLDKDWKRFQIFQPSPPGVAERCIHFSDPELFMDTPSGIGWTQLTATDLQMSPSMMVSQNLDIVSYFRNSSLLCAYMYKRLKGLGRELSMATRTLGEMRDRRLRNCKPFSDRQELLRRVMMKGELLQQIGQIACNSASPQECRAMRFMMRESLRVEKRAEAMLHKYVSWRRSREFPAPRHLNNRRARSSSKRTFLPDESAVLIKQSPFGVVVRKFRPFSQGENFIQKAFGHRQNIGLNIFAISNFK